VRVYAPLLDITQSCIGTIALWERRQYDWRDLQNTQRIAGNVVPIYSNSKSINN